MAKDHPNATSGSYGPQSYINLTELDKQHVVPSDIVERRRRYLIRWTSLKGERSRQWSKWIDLADYILPERGRFLTDDHNKPKVTSKILNNTPTRAARALSAALMSGVTSPARPWFKLTLPNPFLAKMRAVKVWLWQCEEIIRQTLDLSGFYKAMAMGVYPDLATFGSACCLVEEDPLRVARFIPLAMGTYAWAQDGHGRINALLYEEPWTVGELVDEFGWDFVSNSVRTAYNAGMYEQYMVVLRIIEPNSQFIPGMADKAGKPWGSVWMEIGGLGSGAGALLQPSMDPAIGFLRESGYNEFPVLAPRWTTTSRDVYGTGPGHDALPDAKQLMKLESRMLLATAKGVNPAMLMPDTMRMNRTSVLPGDAVYVPAGSLNFKIEPAFVPNPAFMDKGELKIQQCSMRIQQSFFTDLVRTLIDDQRKQPVTAEEIKATQQEAMLQMGPILENINDECLSPLIERVWAILVRRKMLPPPPPQVQGHELKVVFTSILAQAQKAIGTGAKERLMQFVGTVAQMVGPNAVDNIDTDKLIQGYADDLGTPPDCAQDPQKVAAARQVRAQQAQQQQQQQQMMAQAKAAKDAGGADTSSGTLLGKLMGSQAQAEAGPPPGGEQ